MVESRSHASQKIGCFLRRILLGHVHHCNCVHLRGTLNQRHTDIRTEAETPCCRHIHATDTVECECMVQHARSTLPPLSPSLTCSLLPVSLHSSLCRADRFRKRSSSNDLRHTCGSYRIVRRPRVMTCHWVSTVDLSDLAQKPYPIATMTVAIAASLLIQPLYVETKCRRALIVWSDAYGHRTLASNSDCRLFIRFSQLHF